MIQILKYCNSRSRIFKLNQSLLFNRTLKLSHVVKFKRNQEFLKQNTQFMPCLIPNSLPLNVYPSKLQFTCFGCFRIHIRQQKPLSALFKGNETYI